MGEEPMTRPGRNLRRAYDPGGNVIESITLGYRLAHKKAPALETRAGRNLSTEASLRQEARAAHHSFVLFDRRRLGAASCVGWEASAAAGASWFCLPRCPRPIRRANSER